MGLRALSAGMSKLVKERVLKSLGARLTGSSPVPGTKRSLSNKCACGEIGRHTRFRFSRRKTWGFESLQAHQFKLFTPGETKNVAKQTECLDRAGQSCAER